MKPSRATLHLISISFWHSHVHYCIKTAIDYRRHDAGLQTVTDWWIERAKIHAQTAKIHTDCYQAQPN